MIAKLRELFSFLVTNTQHDSERQFNIELVNCPLKEMMCQGHHSSINKSFIESETYRKEKDFNNSIETLKSAFDRTTELMQHPCTSCAQHFRSTIAESMENIHDELGKMSKGLFGRKRYKSSFKKAENVLREFENNGIHKSNQINNKRKLFLGNHLN